MSDIEKTPDEILADLEQQLEAKNLLVRGPHAETKKKIQSTKDDLEYLGLVERFDKLGKQDQRYVIVDVTEHGKGFVVLVIGPRTELHSKTINQASKGEDAIFDAKRVEITRECVQHPALDVYDAMTSELPDLGITCFLALRDLWGARAKIRRGK